MRLLHTESLELRFFMPSHVPDYVILSHRWNAQSSEECSFDDMTRSSLSDPDCGPRKKQGFSKIQGACRLALRDGYSWIWIDSCCIDKSSSAELQESINSMWKYYTESNICYVYLEDVEDSEASGVQRFRESEWFTRGWTVQELIAPVYVEFYARDWSPIGTKSERYEEIADITKIESKVLVRSQEISTFSAAQKLSWVAHRKVTREEDESYSLLGLFDVNMPLLYGEGRERAFMRLQEAIYNSTTDQTLFLFRSSQYENYQPLLASSPTRFCDRMQCALCLPSGLQTVQCLPSVLKYTDIIASERWSTQAHEQIITTVTPHLIYSSTTLELLDYEDVSDELILFDSKELHDEVSHVAVLNYSLNGYFEGALCLLLRRGAGLEDFYRVQCFPAQLANFGELASSLQKTKMLICARQSLSSQRGRVDTTFSVDGDSFHIQEWIVENSIQHSILPVDGIASELKIQMGESEDSEDSDLSAPVSCQIADFQNSTLRISLQLMDIDRIWSIKEVVEIQAAVCRTVFHSSQLVDRCSLQLSSGKRISVGLRRLPAISRVQRDDFVSQYRYQIIVRYLS